MNKAELRKVYKAKRLSLNKEELEILNDAILSELRSFDWSTVKCLHVYREIQKFNEPKTIDFVQWLRMNHPDIQLVISKSDFETGVMVNYLWDDATRFESNSWDILEPVDGAVIDERDIDFVLVPMLVVDVEGNRVGYGKGFYDRFLAKCRPDIQTMGLSFFDPVPAIDDVSTWDRKIQYCVTPTGIIKF